jgi:vacuolar protein sorting-associated protein 45
MKKVLDSIPEMRRESGNLNKHYELIDELIKKIKLRRLLDIGEIEQTLVAKESKADSFKAISDIIPDEKFSSFDLLRLCVLFNLKYEGDPKGGQLFAKLKERLGPQVIRIVNRRTRRRSKLTIR